MNHPFVRGFWLGLMSHAMGRHLSAYALWKMGDQELREHHQRTYQHQCPVCQSRNMPQNRSRKPNSPRKD